MPYESPIKIMNGPPKIDLDGEILRAVYEVGVSVDKDELLRSLQYDRGQYEKGYRDAKAELVLCSGCKFYEPIGPECSHDRGLKGPVFPDDFCPYGKKEDER